MKKLIVALFVILSLGVSAQKIGTNIGDKAPEINMTTTDGSMLKLSSLKGKMVLIDFWASWCGPCRYENPNVVAAFNKYKDANFANGKTFTVYSVSLDSKLESWKNAIESDHLAWPNHVSDLQGWENHAALVYQVESIPSNFLIDGKGIIVAKNLRGSKLDAKLKELKK